MQVKVTFSNGKSTEIELGKDQSFKDFARHALKEGLYFQDDEYERFVPGRQITSIEMPRQQAAPAVLLKAGTPEIVVVILRHFDKRKEVNGTYLNGMLVQPGRIHEWRMLAAAVAVQGPVLCRKEEWTTTISVQNAPPTYAELKKIGVSDKYEVMEL